MQKRSAIWGGATLGFIIGGVIGLSQGNMSLLITGAIVGAGLGVIAEILGIIGDKLKKRA